LKARAGLRGEALLSADKTKTPGPFEPDVRVATNSREAPDYSSGLISSMFGAMLSTEFEPMAPATEKVE
jgi:hypothetical protein